MSGTVHPARSSEFLSRLHDGEVSGPERARFDAHAVTCAECRAAAAMFERALAAYRGAEPVPAAADLSARILRKIRAQSPARRPFGVRFGIDLRWAGASVAAALALLVAVPLLLRSRASPQATPEAISAHLLVEEARAKAEQQAEPQAEPSQVGALVAPAPRSAPPASAPGSKKREILAGAPPSLAAAAPPPAPAAPASKDGRAEIVVRGDAPVGVGGHASRDAAPQAFGSQSRAAASRAASVRLSVRPDDDGGPAPAIIARPPDDRLAVLRGRELLVAIDEAGRLVTAEAAPSYENEPARKQASDLAQTAALEILRAMRFEPGKSPRRLLLRVE